VHYYVFLLASIISPMKHISKEQDPDTADLSEGDEVDDVKDESTELPDPFPAVLVISGTDCFHTHLKVFVLLLFFIFIKS
jgi:hypothetical protein